MTIKPMRIIVALGTIATVGAAADGIWSGIGAFKGVSMWWTEHNAATVSKQLDRSVLRCRFAILWTEHETGKRLPDDCIERAMAELHGRPAGTAN